MMDIKKIRKKIDKIDSKLVKLIGKRVITVAREITIMVMIS